MWIVRLVGALMMPAMNGEPMRRRVLDRADSQCRQDALQPEGTRKAAVREEPVIAQIDAAHPEQKEADHEHEDALPAEEPRNGRERGNSMNDQESGDVVLFPRHSARD